MVGVLYPLVPKAYADTLSVLFDEAPRSTLAEVTRTLTEEFKISQISDVFDTFDPVPVASGSLAQV